MQQTGDTGVCIRVQIPGATLSQWWGEVYGWILQLSHPMIMRQIQQKDPGEVQSQLPTVVVYPLTHLYCPFSLP